MLGDISSPRLLKTTSVLGLCGALVTLIWQGPRNAAGFLVGALLAWITVRSWGKLAESLGTGRPVGSSGLFLALRYVIIGATLYVTIKVLGSSPVAAILGLLMSFAAVLVEIVISTRARH